MELFKNPWEIVSDVLKLLMESVRVGITTLELNTIGESRILELGGTPINKGYHPDWAKSPFPASICVGVNDTIAHGVPTDYKLQEGDLVSFDFGVSKDGICGDAALTVGVGNISARDERLLYYGKKTLQAGIDVVKAGVKIKDISKAIEYCAMSNGYVVNQTFTGHGIGTAMHQLPYIPAATMIPEYREFYEVELKTGDMICLEPLLTYKDKIGKATDDGWTWKTVDGKNSCIFERQLLATEEGCEVLTL